MIQHWVGRNLLRSAELYSRPFHRVSRLSRSYSIQRRYSIHSYPTSGVSMHDLYSSSKLAWISWQLREQPMSEGHAELGYCLRPRWSGESQQLRRQGHLECHRPNSYPHVFFHLDQRRIALAASMLIIIGRFGMVPSLLSAEGFTASISTIIDSASMEDCTCQSDSRASAAAA